MDGQLDIDYQALIREIRRYLAAVDSFRAEQCEPTWLPELSPPSIVHTVTAALGKPASAH
jgi:hypothetical protein